MDSKSSNPQEESKNILPDSIIRIDTVSLKAIDSKDETYRITTQNPLADLVEAIQTFGLLHAPVLIEHSSKYRIVCGFRRIAACRQLGWKSIVTKIHKDNTDPSQIAQLAIADNALQRPLNLVETSRALNLLADASSDEQQLKKAAQVLGLPTHPSAVTKIRQISRLPSFIQNGILSDAFNLSMALDLGRLDAADAAALVGLFSQLKVGLNKQRELHLLLTEIAKREGISIQRLIAGNALQGILQSTDTDRANQRQNIRSYLRQRRYPVLTQAETVYKKQVRQLRLGKHIQLIPPSDFEGTTYAMTLQFKNRQDLRRLKENIENIIAHPALGKILKR